MPIHQNKTKRYYQWGNQTKYYYSKGDTRSQVRAYLSALKQARAIYANSYR